MKTPLEELPIIDIPYLLYNLQLIDLQNLLGESLTKVIQDAVKKLTLEEQKRLLDIFDVVIFADAIHGFKNIV